jgi:hypothetical protein
MTRAALLPILALSACFGAPPEDMGPVELDMGARITNSYVDTIFDLSVFVARSGADGGSAEPIVVFEGERVGTNGRTGRKPFKAFAGDAISFELQGLTLGMPRRFDRITMREPASSTNRTLDLTFDYDLARANFQVLYRWSP